MGKVVTSEGLTEFVTSGKFTHVPNHKAGEKASALETVKPTPTIEVKTDGESDKPAVPAARDTKDPAEGVAKVLETDDELTPEEKALPEKVRKEIQRKNRAVNEKHKAMKEAQEERDASDRLAEQQYNERRLAETRADAAEARLKEFETKAHPSPPAPKEPELKDYQNEKGEIDWVKFQKDTAKWAAEEAVKGERQRQADESSKTEQLKRTAWLIADADKSRESHKDFDAAFQRIKGTTNDINTPFVVGYLNESEKAPSELAYFLATNPEVSQRIAKMKPILGIAELGRLEDSLVKPPSAAANAHAATSVTPRSERGGAPAPITPLDGEGSGGINTDPSKMSYKELRAYHRDQERERRKR